MNIGERIELLLTQNQNLTAAALARHLETKQSTVSGWIKEGRCPSADSILPICKFFHVSTDYLLTGRENPNTALTPEESELLSIFSELPPNEQSEILGFVKGYTYRNSTTYKNFKTS